jgi:hypothetical protein
LLAACLLTTACSDATGTTKGGDPRFDAAPPEMPVPPQPVSDAAVDGEGGLGGGITWTDLYRDFFGPSPAAKASCSFSSGCHGAADRPGAQASNGFVCPPPAGPSSAEIATARTACYESLKTSPANMLQGTSWKQTRLYGVLRKASGEPTIDVPMPLQPSSVAFTDQELKRIEDWFAAGAKND